MINITYNVYCDESCHLEADAQKAMVLGAVWANKEILTDVSKRIKEIKTKHHIKAWQEVKWVRISPKKVDLYLDLVDYFFDNTNLHFRGLVIPDKSVLDHAAHHQTHDDWYYKMYFNLLKVILNNSNRYNIYLDIKDTQGGNKVDNLHQVLANDCYDFERKIIHRIQQIRSHESQLLQLTDILIGAIMYKNRGEYSSEAKTKVMQRVEERSGYTMKKNTLFTESKFNLLIWNGGQVDL